MANHLTRGAIAEIIAGGTPEGPALQILSMKRIPSGTQERYRLLISDGQWSSSNAILATQLHGMVASGEINLNCIIQIDRYVCNTVQGDKRVLIILEMKVLQSGADVGQRIGDPQPFDDKKNNTATVIQNAKTAFQLPVTPPVTPVKVQHNMQNVTASPADNQMRQNIYPIESLSPYRNKWIIRARVINKSDVRHYSNSRGEGKLFNVEFLDESGEIRATGLNQELDKFYGLLEVNKVYYVRDGTIKTANKQYNKLDHDYEMTFNTMTEIKLCEDDDFVPRIKFSFLSISEIANVEKDAVVDVIGICKEFGDMQMRTIRSRGKELEMRELQLVDDSNAEVTVTLWGRPAETFDGSQQPVIAFKRVRVSDFNGKTLYLVHSSSFQINPDITEAHRLRVWFENYGNQQDMTLISSHNGTNGTGGLGTNFKTFAEAKFENLGARDTPDYYTVNASVVFLKKENCLYTACPSDGCNKKVIDMINDLYRCEKCNREYNNFKWRLWLSGNLADATDNNWFSCFGDQAEKLLGITAQELGEMREIDSDKFHKVFSDASFKQFTMKLRVKMETYNDESRLKTTLVAIEPLDPITYNKRLLSEVKQMIGLV